MNNRPINLLILCALLLAIPAAYAGKVGRVVRLGEREGMPQTVVNCVIQDSTGYVWIATRSGLVRFDGHRARLWRREAGSGSGLLTNRIMRIHQLGDGNIFCRYENGECFRFDRVTESFSPMAPVDEPPLPHVDDSVRVAIESLPEFAGTQARILYRDRQGGWWVTSSGGHYRVEFVDAPIAPDGLAAGREDVVRAIALHRGRVFIADKNGYVRVDGSGWLGADGRLSADKVMFGHNAYSMLSADSVLWMGVKPGGLLKISEGKVEADARLKTENVYDIASDGQGGLWAGSFPSGLWHRGRKGEIEAVGGAGKVRCVLPLGGGRVLAGGDSGLFLLAKGSGKPVKILADIITEPVMGVAAFSGGICVATYGNGVIVLDDSLRVTGHLTAADGLADDICLGIAADSDDRIYVITEQSVTRYDPSDGTCMARGASLFAPGFVFIEGKPLIHDGTLWAGTSKGVARIPLASFTGSGYSPRIVFDLPDTVVLSPDRPNLEVGFSALDFSRRDDIRYAYHIEGLDDTVRITDTHTLNFASLPPGEFRLHVRSTNGDGRWCDNKRILYIRRQARLTETKWFWMATGVLGLVALFFAVRLTVFIRRLQRELRRLATENNERSEYIRVRLHDMIARIPTADSADDPREENQFKKQALDWLEANYMNPDLSVDDMASAMAVSRTKLYRIVKEAFGLSPNNLLQQTRIDRAAEMLAAGNKNVSEVAYACGWSDPKYFSRVFRKVKGVAPSDWRRN